MSPNHPLRSKSVHPAFAALVCFLLLAGRAPAAEMPGAPAVSLGEFAGSKALLLAIDDYALPLRRDLCYYISTPTVRAEPVLTTSRGNPHATDTALACCYGTVLHEGGKFRMWYYGMQSAPSVLHQGSGLRAVHHEGPVCYAESIDGLHWTKPNLGQVSFHGGSDNNAIALPAEETEGAFLIRDDSDPNPARRYKMIYENTSGPRPVVESAISADGIVWVGHGRVARLLEPSSFYRFNGLFTVNAQNLAYVSEGGHQAGRQGYAWFSPDFDHWLPESGESFLLPEPANPNDRGHDRQYVQVHLGVGAVSYGNVMVGLYCQWHDGAMPGDWFGVGTTFGDFGLLVSSDGQHFREPVKGHVFLSRHQSRAKIAPDIRGEEVLTQSGNSILNVGNETWIYHGRWMNTENPKDWYTEIALATLPRDRWGALGLAPHAAEGTVWSAPLTLGTGVQVTLNADGVQGCRVEIADANFRLLPDYSGANAGTVAGADGLDCAVRWPKGSLDALAGRRLRLLIHLQRGDYAAPRLFALNLFTRS